MQTAVSRLHRAERRYCFCQKDFALTTRRAPEGQPRRLPSREERRGSPTRWAARVRACAGVTRVRKTFRRLSLHFYLCVASEWVSAEEEVS